MANGSTDHKVAKAERRRERSAQHARVAEEYKRKTQGLIAEFRRSQLQSISDSDDEVSEVTANLKGIHAKTKLAGWVRSVVGVALAVGILLVLVAIAWRLAR